MSRSEAVSRRALVGWVAHVSSSAKEAWSSELFSFLLFLLFFSLACKVWLQEAATHRSQGRTCRHIFVYVWRIESETALISGSLGEACAWKA